MMLPAKMLVAPEAALQRMHAKDTLFVEAMYKEQRRLASVQLKLLSLQREFYIKTQNVFHDSPSVTLKKKKNLPQTSYVYF